MCGTFSDPSEIARALAVAAADKVVVNQTGKGIEEINIELGRQMALLYKTILAELSREGEDEGFEALAETHGHVHPHDGHAHTHSHGH
jgi:hypothetical protein